MVVRIRGSLSEAITLEAKPVVLKDKVIKNGIMECPHCKQEIHEKGTLTHINESGKMRHYHGACGGEIILPPPSPAEQKFLDQLRSHVSDCEK